MFRALQFEPALRYPPCGLILWHLMGVRFGEVEGRPRLRAGLDACVHVCRREHACGWCVLVRTRVLVGGGWGGVLGGWVQRVRVHGGGQHVGPQSPFFKKRKNNINQYI